jgi:hypothetical protein
MDMTRRQALRVVAAGSLLGAMAGAAGAQQKMTPQQVQYQDKPKKDQQCSKCLQFVAPDQCKLVSGKIKPEGWCALFAPKPK